MGKADKLIKKLSENRASLPGEIRIEDVECILLKYFDRNQIKNYKGSHLVLKDDRLEKYSNAGNRITIPVRKGHVKKYYIVNVLLPLVEYMNQLESKS